MGCKFCESGRVKKVRNLTTSEMVEQILRVEEDINSRITHIVIMGIGEPFDNYINFTRFVEIVNYQKGINIGARHITVSTCGIVPNIVRLAQDAKGINLALSLHSAIEEKRKKIMKIANKYTLEDTMRAIREFFIITKRRLSLEYSLIKGFNDGIEDVKALCNLCKTYLDGCEYYINLIKVNEISETNFKKPSDDAIMKFRDYLNNNGIVATIRRTLGEDISGSCGQLRNSYIA